MTEPLTVATYNLYLGARLIPTYGAPTVAAMTDALRDAHAGMVRTDFRGRAVAIAELLTRDRPDVIGLQEVALWDNAGEVCDFLEILCAELSGHCEYRVAAVTTNSSLAFHTNGATIRYTDRSVVLVRADHQQRDSGHRVFSERFRFPTTPGIIFTKLRGWCWADVHVGGLSVLVACTHLEAYDLTTAAQQAAELRDTLTHYRSPVVVLGDLNCGPGQPDSAYDLFTRAHYRDAWPDLFGQNDGFTGEQSATLTNEHSTLYRRVDHVLWRGERLLPRRIELLGAAETDRRVYGLWPSDRACLVAEFIVR